MSSRTARPALRWTAYVLVAIAFAIACAFLSNWQFLRGEERSAELALVAENYDAEPVPLADLLPVGAEFDPDDEWHPVILEGEYVPADQLLARNRPHGGTAAYEVLVPFRTDDGRLFLVDRGWVPPGADQPEPDEIPAPPAGHVTVVVRLTPGEALPSSGRSAPEGQVPTINLPLIADTIPGGEDLVTSAYGDLVSEDPAPATTPQPFDEPTEDPGPHLSYAIQWILFAIMGFVFIGYIIRTELKHRREDADDVAAAKARASAAAARRRDRDADDEDALLDELSR